MRKKIQEVSNRYSTVSLLALALSITSLTTSPTAEKDSVEEKVSTASVIKDKDQEKSKDKNQDKKSEDFETIETEVEKTDDVEPTLLNIQYSLEEQFQAEQFYQTAALDYEALFKPPPKSVYNPEEEYSADVVEENESEMLTMKEAKEKFTKMQYASILGAHSDVNFEDRRKFNWWIKFNPAEFGLLQAHSLTNDVNYASW